MCSLQPKYIWNHISERHKVRVIVYKIHFTGTKLIVRINDLAKDRSPVTDRIKSNCLDFSVQSSCHWILFMTGMSLVLDVFLNLEQGSQGKQREPSMSPRHTPSYTGNYDTTFPKSWITKLVHEAVRICDNYAQ